MTAPFLGRMSFILAGSLLLLAGPAQGQPGEPKKPRTDIYGDPLPAGAIARLGTLRFRNADGFFFMGGGSLIFTPDDRFLVSGGAGPAVVWDAESGKEIRRLGSSLVSPHGAASLSSDGKFVAVGGWSQHPGENGAVYELATGRMLFHFGNRERGGQNMHASFSPDGAMLVIFGLNPPIELLDASNGKRIHSLEGHGTNFERGDGIIDARFSPDSKTVISVGGDRTIRLWDAKTGKQTKLIEVDGESIRQAMLSPDGKLLASVSYAVKRRADGSSVFNNDRLIRIWDLQAGEKAREILVPPDGEKDGLPLGASMVGFTPDGGLMTRGGDDVMRVWDIRTGKELRHWADKHRTGVIAFSPDGKKYAAIEGGRSISIRDPTTKEELVRTDGHRNSVRAVAVSADGKTFATTDENRALVLWDRSTSKPKSRLTGHKERVGIMEFSPDGRTLYTVHDDYMLFFWDTTTGKERKRIAGEREGWGRIALSPDGKRLAWSARKGEILFLDASTGVEVGKLKTTDRLEQIAFTTDGKSLLAWQMGPRGENEPRDDRVMRWDIATGQRKETRCDGLPDYAFAVAFSPDRSLIAFGGQQGDVMLADVATGLELRRLNEKANKVGQEGAIFCAVFSPDGHTLAWSGPKDGIVRLSEVATGKERRRLVGHAVAHAAVKALGFTLDGRHLISGGADTTCLVWDLMGPAGWGDEPPAPLNDKTLAECWDHLRSADAAKAYLALRRLVADPKRAVPYLHQQLRPIVSADEKRVAKLVSDLDRDDFNVRDAAMRELEKTGDVVLAGLRKALAAKPALKTRRRLEQLVEKLDSMNPSRLQALRAIEALEYIGSPEAQQLLQSLAKGAPGAHQTREAQESVQRLAKR